MLTFLAFCWFFICLFVYMFRFVSCLFCFPRQRGNNYCLIYSKQPDELDKLFKNSEICETYFLKWKSHLTRKK